MRLKFVNRTLLASVLVIGLALIPVVAFAEHGSADSETGSGDTSTTSTGTSSSGDSSTTEDSTTSSDQTSTESETDTHTKSEVEARVKELEAEHGIRADHRLTAGNLKSCEARTAAVKKIMARIVERGTNQTDLFSTIATRTEAFYTKQGKTLTNYDALVSAVNSAQSTALLDLQTLKAEDTFSCSTSNPKGQVAAFQSALKTEIADLKAFKTAVKNLIVGVKSVQSTTSSSTGEAQ